MRPADHAAPQPAGDFTPTALPADVHVDPPADGWWKKKGACPRGTRLVNETIRFEGHTWTAHHCVGGKGKDPRPSTTIRTDDSTQREEGWWDGDGHPHGAIHVVTFAYEETRLYVHDVEEGRWTDRARDGSQDSFSTHRAGKCHGEQREDLGGRASGGWCVDNVLQGTWFVWNTRPDLVRAKLQYKDGELDGAQRWWTRDGTVLARGAFTAGDGTWTVTAPGGVISEMRCHGRELVEGTARDRGGKIIVHVCGKAAPAGCGAAVGPQDGEAQIALGADIMMCPDPTVPPLAMF